jgi:hypothetical protein
LEFYETILEGARFSKFRMLMSSLYFGNGLMEQHLIDEIEKNLTKNKRLKVLPKLD